MEAIARQTLNNDIISIFMVGCLGTVALAKSFFPAKFRAFSFLLQNNRFFLGRSNDTPLTSGFNILLFLVQVASISIFIYLVLRAVPLNYESNSFLLLSRIILLYILFIATKVLGEKMMAVLFDGEIQMASYHYFKLSYHNLVGILLLPVNALMLYTFQDSRLVIFIALFVFVGINGIILFKSLLPHSRVISKHPFYFILYLCALEIAPYFIVYKFVGPPLEI